MVTSLCTAFLVYLELLDRCLIEKQTFGELFLKLMTERETNFYHFLKTPLESCGGAV